MRNLETSFQFRSHSKLPVNIKNASSNYDVACMSLIIQDGKKLTLCSQKDHQQQILSTSASSTSIVST